MRCSLVSVLLLIGCKGDQEPVDTDGTLSASSAPTMSVTSPERAAFIADGDAALTGDVSSVVSVTVNGEEHAVTGSTFSAPVSLARGINHFETIALGADGSRVADRRAVLAGTFAPAEGAIEGAVAARVNQGGLDAGAEIIGGMVDAQSLNGDLSALNPVVDLDYGLGTGIAVDLQSVYFGQPMVDLVAQDGALAVEVILPELLVGTDALISVLWIETDQELELSARYAVIRADLGLSIADDGTVAASMADTAVSLEGFTYDISLLPGEIIEDNLFDDTIRETLEGMLAEQMQALLPAAVTSLQQELDLRFETELLGTAISLEPAFADIGVDSDGVWLGMDLLVDAGGTDLGGAGYLTGSVAAPDPDRAADGAVMVADDALNRTFYELWLGGLLSQRLSTEDGTLDPAALSSFGIERATVTTDAGLPPVLVEVDGATQLQLGEVTVALDSPGFPLGESLVARVAGTVALDFSFDDGAIVPELSDLILAIDIIDTDWQQDPEDIAALLKSFLTPETLLGALDGLTLALPALDGLRIDGATIDRAETGFHSDLQLQISAD